MATGRTTSSSAAGRSDSLSYSGRTLPVIAGGAGAEDFISDDTETIKGGKAGDTLDFSTALLGHNLWGGAGNDTVRGGAGNDKVYGEAGNDVVTGGGAKDNVIDGGDGDDTMGASGDGFAETVTCGLGVDSYVANAEDIFKNCETAGVAGSLPEVASDDGAALGGEELDEELDVDGDELDDAAEPGGCSTSRGGASLVLAFALIALAMRRRRGR
jgi:Ca2+-binding RTX toxin-like protein